MKNKIVFVYLLIVMFLFVLFMFSAYIESNKEITNKHAKETQQIEETIDAGARLFIIQLTAIAEETPYP